MVGADVYGNTQFSRRMEFPLYPSADAAVPSLTMNPRRETSDYNRKISLMNYQLMLDYNKNLASIISLVCWARRTNLIPVAKAELLTGILTLFRHPYFGHNH
ncbi:hypothetical protein KRR40_29705 [Niabella defluvii]|nr:hypothetical protein KRR40_29705 [Niabella sp. I65]